MNNDLTARSARRIATLIAIPLALIAGLVVFAVLRPAPPTVAAPSPSPSAGPRPVPTAPHPMTQIALNERATLVCRALIAKLPEKVRELVRRPVTAGVEHNAAYGDPALTLTCGGAVPTFPPTDRVYTMDAVCWYASNGGQTWTTVDREVAVEVNVPSGQGGDGSGQWPKAFSGVIAATIPSARTKPFGCA